jgi:hypothetical protein
LNSQNNNNRPNRNNRRNKNGGNKNRNYKKNPNRQNNNQGNFNYKRVGFRHPDSIEESTANGNVMQPEESLKKLDEANFNRRDVEPDGTKIRNIGNEKPEDDNIGNRKIDEDRGNRSTSNRRTNNGNRRTSSRTRYNNKRNDNDRNNNDNRKGGFNRKKNFKKNHHNDQRTEKQQSKRESRPAISTKTTGGVSGLYAKYEELLDRTVELRKVFFEEGGKTKDFRYKNRLEKDYLFSLKQLANWKKKLAPWQKEFLNKKTDRYPEDVSYTKEHPEDDQTTIPKGPFEDPHFLDSQKEALEKYKKDEEESSGTEYSKENSSSLLLDSASQK